MSSLVSSLVPVEVFHTVAHSLNDTPRSVGCLNERKLSLPDAPSYSENEEEHIPEKGNAIPLPPRDLARTRTLLAGKPRHERKHPLIIPTSSIAHSIALSQSNPAEPTYLGLEDDPPPEKEAVVSNKPVSPKEGEDGFDEQIANEIDLLDDLGEDLSTHV